MADEQNVRAFRRLEVGGGEGEVDGDGERVEVDGPGEPMTIPLLGFEYDGEWLRYVDDAEGATVPGLHFFVMVEYRDVRNRRTTKQQYLGLVPWYWDESNLRDARNEDGELEYPPGEYLVQLKDQKGWVVKSKDITLGGRLKGAVHRPGRNGPPAGNGDLATVMQKMSEEKAAEMAALRAAHAAEIERLTVEGRRLRELIEREREGVQELRAQVLTANFEVERRELALVSAREMRAQAERRAAEAEAATRAAERRAIEAEHRASHPPDLADALQQLGARRARDQAVLEQVAGMVGPAPAPEREGAESVLEDAVTGVHSMLKEVVSMGKTAMRGIEAGTLAKEADALGAALADKT